MKPHLARSLCAAASVAALIGCSMIRGDGRDIAQREDGELMSVVEAIGQVARTPDPGMGAAAGEVSLQGAPLEGRSVLYALHLASYRSESSAEAGWRILSTEAPAALSDLHPRLETVDLGPDRGVYLRLKAGPLDSRAEAAARCASLVSSGHYCQAVDFAGADLSG